MKAFWLWMSFAVLLLLTMVGLAAQERRYEIDYFHETELVEVPTEHRWIAPTGQDGPIKVIRHYRVVRSTDPSLKEGQIVTRWYPR